MKLHIGCGKKVLPGFINVDIQKHENVDVVCSMLELSKHFKPNSIDEIYACHVCEHIGRHDIQKLFLEFAVLLRPNGILRIAVPDIQKAIEMYSKGVPLYPTLYGQLWGGQRNQYDYHNCGFDFATLQHFLESAGFDNIQRYDWRDFLPPDFDDYSRSYLPHMDMENGTLMSLNVTARKASP